MKGALIALALTCTSLYSGVIFGWAPLQLILEEDGVYSSDCEEGEECTSQQKRFSLLYTLATSVFMFGGFFSGLCVDHFGPTKTTILTGLFVSIGMLLLGIARSDQGSLFMISGLSIAAGGSLTMLNSFPLGFIVEPEFIPLVMTSVNCLFDASGVIFLLCYLVYHHLKFTRAEIFVSLSVIAAVLYSILTAAWWHFEPELIQRKHLVASSEETVMNDGEADIPHNPPPHVELSSMELEMCGVESLDSSQTEANQKPEKSSSSSKLAESSHDSTYFTPWTSQLTSPKFIFVTIYASVSILRSNAFFGIVKEILVRLGDEDTGYLYTQIFVASLPLGFMFIPVINHCLVTFGFVSTFRLISVLGILYGGFVLVPSLESQILTFLAFTIFRSFLFAVIGTYFARMFGPINAGRLYGSMSVAASVVNLLQYPAFLLLGDMMFYLNLVLLLLAFPLSVLIEKMLKPILVKFPEADVKQVKAD